jgi:hypothetical protein
MLGLAEQDVIARPRPASQRDWLGRCNERLASLWPKFVDCSRRMSTEGPFLLDLLECPPLRVLDTAMGIGCETIFLTSNNFSVTGNEINRELRSVALARAKEADVTIDVSSVDWRMLPEAFAKIDFDVVLCLGNSLCLLPSIEIVREVARSFRSVCALGGKLIVDQRNFDYIRRNREEILRGNFRYSRKVIYCGKDIVGKPIEIERKHVRFVYQDVQSKAHLGYLDMYPFQEDELVQVFLSAGFNSLSVYSDLVEGYKDDADFYTYVFN